MHFTYRFFCPSKNYPQLSDYQRDMIRSKPTAFLNLELRTKKEPK